MASNPRLAAVAAAALLGACAHAPQPAACPKEDRMLSPDSSSLTPLLQHPYGMVLRVVAEVGFRAADSRAKADSGSTWVRVESVGDAPLAAPATLTLERGWSAPADALPSAPGHYVLLGYETLRASGQPDGIMRHAELRDFPMSADVGFRVERIFAVLKVAGPAK